MARQDMWKHLVIKHQLGNKGKKISKKASKHQRASGGGRKREFQPQINQLKDWLERERSAGHSISKEDVIQEMESLIHIRAEQCLVNAQQQDQHPESAKAWENEAKISHERIKKLEESKQYRQQYANSLISWIGAKAYHKEQSAEISPQEGKISAQLTWQGIDHKLWLMGASSLQELESAGIVSDPASVISNRSLLSIGMSGQVPIWAKAMPSRVIFSEHELAGHSYQERKKISELREEIEAAAKMIKKRPEEDGEHPPPIIGEILPEDHKKLLSGSKTSRAESAVEKWRITYEARQRISNITGNGPPVGSVEKGLLIFPGSHASLDQFRRDHRNKGSGKLYHVGFYDIIRGVVAAADELRNQNHQNSWVLAATIRNGILAFLPDPSKGIWVPVADQEWASQFKAGSKRIPSDWLEHKLSWLKDGVPIKPDFNLSARIKAAEDLISWSYHGGQDDEHLEKLEDQEKDQEKGQIEDEDQKTSDSIIDIPDDVDEEMLIPASNSFFLQISPHLRKQHQWNKRRLSYQETVESARAKFRKAEDRAQKRDQLRSFARKMLKDKLKIMSRSEAISDIMPIAKRKQTSSAKGRGKGKVKKLSSMLKKSM